MLALAAPEALASSQSCWGPPGPAPPACEVRRESLWKPPPARRGVHQERGLPSGLIRQGHQGQALGSPSSRDRKPPINLESG